MQSRRQIDRRDSQDIDGDREENRAQTGGELHFCALAHKQTLEEPSEDVWVCGADTHR